MKKVLFFLAASLCIATLAFSQREETLANSSGIKGGFGGPFFLFSTADGNAGGGAGGGGAFIINDFFIGGYGQGESFGRRRYNNRNYDVTLGSGGFWLGYAYPSHKVLHIYTSLKLGWGTAALRRPGGDNFEDDITDGVFMVAPEVGAEVNLLHWFRLAFSGGYRVVGGLHGLPGFSTNDFNSPTLAITLRFGGFGYK